MSLSKFYWLSAGHCFHPKKITIRNAGLGLAKYPSYFGVIRHESIGVILYDTGYTEDFHKETASLPEKLYALVTPVVCDSSDSCIFKLQEKGIHPDEVKIVIISHLHADHICGLKHFKNAKFYLDKNGLDYLKSLNRARQVSIGFLRNLLPDNFENRIVNLQECKDISLPVSLKPFEKGIDLLGDKSLIAVPLPGHMLGHIGLYFNYNGQDIFIVGDSVWHSESIRKNIMPHFISSIIANNWKIFGQTIYSLNQLHKNNKDLLLLPSHCDENDGKFK